MSVKKRILRQVDVYPGGSRTDTEPDAELFAHRSRRIFYLYSEGLQEQRMPAWTSWVRICVSDEYPEFQIVSPGRRDPRYAIDFVHAPIDREILELSRGSWGIEILNWLNNTTMRLFESRGYDFDVLAKAYRYCVAKEFAYKVAMPSTSNRNSRARSGLEMEVDEDGTSVITLSITDWGGDPLGKTTLRIPALHLGAPELRKINAQLKWLSPTVVAARADHHDLLALPQLKAEVGEVRDLWYQTERGEELESGST